MIYTYLLGIIDTLHVDNLKKELRDSFYILKTIKYLVSIDKVVFTFADNVRGSGVILYPSLPHSTIEFVTKTTR